MRGLPALARDLALFIPIHRSKSAILSSHVLLPPGAFPTPGLLRVGRVERQRLGCNADATRIRVSLSIKSTCETFFRAAADETVEVRKKFSACANRQRTQ